MHEMMVSVMVRDSLNFLVDDIRLNGLIRKECAGIT